MNGVRELLADHPFTAGLADDDLDAMAACGRLVAVRARQRVAREGDPADGLHLLLEGRISLETHLPRRGDVVLSTVEPGGVVGWSWMFPPHEWQVDAVAAVDSTAVVLEAGPLRAVLEARPRLDAEVTRRLARVVTGRLVEARTQLLDLYGTPGGPRR